MTVVGTDEMLDRIDELEAERDHWEVVAIARQARGIVLAQKLDAAEAKLTKAVEALRNVVAEYDLFRKKEYERGMSPLDDEMDDARTTLAELKGQKDE